MVENTKQIKEIVDQYNALLQQAGDIVRLETDWKFNADSLDNDPQLLASTDNADEMISVWGDDGCEFDHYKIPLAWFFLNNEELKEAIAEKKRKEAEERARREEERKKQQAEEKAMQEKKIEECERRTLALLIEKYGADGGIK